MANSAAKNISGYRLLLLLLLFAVLYLPSLKNGYVGWDDALIHSNRNIRSLSLENMTRIFIPQPGSTASYQPLRTLANALVFALNGPRPLGYLLFNILLYLVNILLFYKTVRILIEFHGDDRLKVSSHASALVSAAAFGLLPVHVEVVSWIQGGKQTLMAAFFLGSFICYLRFRDSGKEKMFWLSVALYGAALVSQPGAIAFPLLILGYEALTAGHGNRFRKEWLLDTGLRILPFILPAVLLGAQLLFISTVRKYPVAELSFVSSLFTVPLLWGKYLIKLFLPVNICCRYPMTVPGTPPLFAGSAAALALAGLAWAACRAAGEKKLAGLGLIWFAVTLLPTSGLVRTSTLMADRYLYLPSMGFAILPGLIFGNLLAGAGASHFIKARSSLLTALVLAVAAGWALVTVKRELDWRDGVALWSRVVSLYPEHDLATFNLADALQREGKLDEAIKHYQKVIRINPDYGDAYSNLGVCLRLRGEDRKAIGYFERARSLRPDRAEVWINLGISYANVSRDSAAFAAFEKGIDLGGRSAWAGYYNRAKLLLSGGSVEESVADMEKAARYAPQWVTSEAWLDLGRTLERLGRVDLAVELLSLGKGEAAFDASCWRILGNLEILSGNPSAAIETLKVAAARDPEDYQTYVLLGFANQQANFTQDAVKAYRRALAMGGPDREKVLNNLALILAETGKLDQAEKVYLEALAQKPDFIEAWVNLGILYRTKGDLTQARRSLEKALRLCAERQVPDNITEGIKQILDGLGPQ
ncbi:MAG TPA: tetratricopeptide repeat protein [archaeon]|nr:tetratricopeptide repeat protein [archaeon]